jgi:methionyl-tRNA synthetase
MYVWCDALTNYLSGIGYTSDEKKFKRYWPADIHVIGKDINKFHSLLWPAMLKSAGLETPKMVLIHGFLTIDGKKMSKSLGNVSDPKEIAAKYGIDPFRFALLRYTPTMEDGDFSERLLVEKTNEELANNLGNFVNRTLKFVETNFGKVPKPKKFGTEILEKITVLIESMESELEKGFNLHRALKDAMEISSIGNQYFQEQKPWESIKSDQEKCEETLFVCANIVRTLAIVLEPFLPKTAERIWDFLGLETDIHKENWEKSKKFDLHGNRINNPEPLFKKMEI